VGKGTGLGLATAYGIVKQHHGWIEVETKEGVGTTFTIMLPASEKRAEVRPQAVGPAEAPRGSETVLVVEDEEPLRLLVTEVLRHSGYTVHSAANGADAVAIWKRHRDEIDMLLTDIMMPDGMSGYELAERILRDEPELPVLFTSGYATDVVGGSAPVAGRSFLQKPYDPVTLAQAVRDCLDTKKPARREVAHS
jgi:two-component system, cell cycle sensor histidine kinase and response regulator CckA